MVHLTSADISDSAGAQAILDAIRNRWPWVKHLFADSAYDRLKLMDKAAIWSSSSKSSDPSWPIKRGLHEADSVATRGSSLPPRVASVFDQYG
jgi:hypothetical protein